MYTSIDYDVIWKCALAGGILLALAHFASFLLQYV